MEQESETKKEFKEAPSEFFLKKSRKDLSQRSYNSLFIGPKAHELEFADTHFPTPTYEDPRKKTLPKKDLVLQKSSSPISNNPISNNPTPKNPISNNPIIEKPLDFFAKFQQSCYLGNRRDLLDLANAPKKIPQTIKNKPTVGKAKSKTGITSLLEKRRHLSEEPEIIKDFIVLIKKIQKEMEFLDEEFRKKTGISLEARKSVAQIGTEKQNKELSEELEKFVEEMAQLIVIAKTTPLLKKDLQAAYEKVVEDHERSIDPNTPRKNVNASLRSLFLGHVFERFTLPSGCLNRICLRSSTIEELERLLSSFVDCGLRILPSDTILNIFTEMERILSGLLIPVELMLEGQITEGVSLRELSKKLNLMKGLAEEKIQYNTGRKKSRVTRDFVVTENGIDTLVNVSRTALDSASIARSKALTAKRKEIFFYRKILKTSLQTLSQIEKNVFIDIEETFASAMKHPYLGRVAKDFRFICNLFQEQAKTNLNKVARNISEETFLQENMEIIKKNSSLMVLNRDLIQEKSLQKEIISDVNEKLDSLYVLLHYEKKRTTLFLKASHQNLIQESQEKIAERLKKEEEYNNLLQKFKLVSSHRLSQRNLKKIEELVKENSPEEEDCSKISLLNTRKKTLEFYLNLIKNENLSLEAEITKLRYFTVEAKPVILESFPEKESVLIESLQEKEDLSPIKEELLPTQNPLSNSLVITPENAMKEQWFFDFVQKYSALNERTKKVSKITLDVIEQKHSLEEEVRSLKQKEKENAKIIEDLKRELFRTKASADNVSKSFTSAFKF